MIVVVVVAVVVVNNFMNALRQFNCPVAALVIVA